MRAAGSGERKKLHAAAQALIDRAVRHTEIETIYESSVRFRLSGRIQEEMPKQPRDHAVRRTSCLSALSLLRLERSDLTQEPLFTRGRVLNTQTHPWVVQETKGVVGAQ